MKTRSRLSLIGSILMVGATALPSFAQIIKRDYDFQTPVPLISRITIRDNIRNLPKSKLFTRCPDKTVLLEYAESSKYSIMICSDEKNTRQEKYWIQNAKNGSGKLTLTAFVYTTGAPFYKYGDEIFSILTDDDGIKPVKFNAYLERYNSKTKIGSAEALLYHYHRYYQDLTPSKK